MILSASCPYFSIPICSILLLLFYLWRGFCEQIYLSFALLLLHHVI